jgi:hypothetical protein
MTNALQRKNSRTERGHHPRGSSSRLCCETTPVTSRARVVFTAIAWRLRDVIMPMAMKLAKPEKTAWQYNHHIDWAAPVSAPDTELARPDLAAAR